jgi:hypothetical protein
VVQRAAHQLAEAFPGIAITATLDGYGDHAAKIDETKNCHLPSSFGMAPAHKSIFLSVWRQLAGRDWLHLRGYLDQLANGLRFTWLGRCNHLAASVMREPRRLARRGHRRLLYFTAHLDVRHCRDAKILVGTSISSTLKWLHRIAVLTGGTLPTVFTGVA